MDPGEPDPGRRPSRMELTAWLCFAVATALFWLWVKRALDLERTEEVSLGLLVVAAALAGVAVVLMVAAGRRFRRTWDGRHSRPPDHTPSDEVGDGPRGDTEWERRVESDTSSVSAVLRKAAYLLLLLGFACFMLYVGAVAWNLGKPSPPIEKVALTASVVALVLGVVCVIGAGRQQFGRREYRSAFISLSVTALFALFSITDRLRRDYDRPGGLQELLRALVPWLLLAGVTALVGGLAVVLLRSLAETHSGKN